MHHVTSGQQASVVALHARVPGVKVDFDVELGAPTFIRSTTGFLTGPDGAGRSVTEKTARRFSAMDPHRGLKGFLTEHAGLFGHGAEALEASRIQRDYATPHSGMQTVIWEQEVDGIPVYQARLIAHTTRRGELISVASRFIPDSDTAATRGNPNRASLIKSPHIPAAHAVALAAQHLGETSQAFQLLAGGPPAAGAEKHQAFTGPGLKEPADVRLTWLPMDRSTLRLCWSVMLWSISRDEKYLLMLDAATGEVLERISLTFSLSDATYRVYTDDSPRPCSPSFPVRTTEWPPLVDRELVTLSAWCTNASPLGWIPDGGNETLGNNVAAQTDWDNNNVPDLPRPQGSPFRVFDFPVQVETPATTNYAAAGVVQAFYLGNLFHDRLYQAGFTEAAGNYQTDNFGRGGLGNDAMLIDVQDGGGVNNAYFHWAPEGQSGRVSLHLYNGGTYDSALDASVVYHELTHGLSQRLVGGGLAMSAAQSKALGEGWSDFYPLMLLSEEDDDLDGIYPSSGWVYRNYWNGVRRYPYTTSMSNNPLTFANITVNPAMHPAGEVWCVTLWEAYVNLVRKHGWAVANPLALQLMTDGMKLTPAYPSYIQARDAILLADLVAHGGDNHDELWQAFAKRGLGYSATGVNSFSMVVTEAFDLPGDLWITPLAYNPAGSLIVKGPVGGPFTPASQVYLLTNTDSNALDWTVTLSGDWLNMSLTNGMLAAGTADVPVTATIAADHLGQGIYTNILTFSNLTGGRSETRKIIAGVGLIDYFTQSILPPDANKLVYRSFQFRPDGSENYYSCGYVSVSNFPSDSAGSTALAFSNGVAIVILTNDATVSLYGMTTNLFYVSQRGAISLGSADNSAFVGPASYANYFSKPRICMLSGDYTQGEMSYKQRADRVVITFRNVFVNYVGFGNNMQAELFYDGRITLSYLDQTHAGGMFGLSRGTGVPTFFMESDYAAYPEDDLADVAVTGAVMIPDPPIVGSPFTILLSVTNYGPDTARDVIVTNTLPPDVAFISGAVSQGTVDPVGNGVVLANLGDLDANAGAVIEIVALASERGWRTNVVTISTSTRVLDANNATNLVTRILAPPHLGVSPASYDFGPVRTGAVVQAWFTVTNSGDLVLSGTAEVVDAPFAIISGSPYTVAGGSSTTVVLGVTAPAVETYTGEMIFISNGGTCTNPVSATGSVDAPVAIFAGTPTNGPAALTVTFSDTSSGIVTNRRWDFGDGTTLDTDQTTVEHTYVMAGVKTVTLTVHGPVGDNTLVRSGYVNVSIPAPSTWTRAAAVGNWSDAGNWSPAVVPDYGADAIIGTGGSTSVLDGVSRILGSLVFNRAAPFTIASSDGAGLTLQAGIVASNNYTYTIDAPVLMTGTNAWQINAGTLCVGGPVASDPVLIKTGVGTLTLLTSNVLTAGVSVRAGNVAIGHDVALGTEPVMLTGGGLSNAPGSWVVANTLNLVSNAIVGVGGPDTLTFSGSIINTGALMKTGSGILTLSGTNTYSGSTTVRGGVLNVDGGVITNTAGINLNTTAGSRLVVTNAGKVYNNVSFNMFIENTGSLVVDGVGSLFNGGGKEIRLSNAGNSSGNSIHVANGGVVTNVSQVWFCYTQNNHSNTLIVTNGGRLVLRGPVVLAKSGGGGSGAIYANTVYVGSSTTSTSVIQGVSNGNILLGASINDYGNGMIVDGGGLVTNVGAFHVGTASNCINNFLIITNGGLVYNKATNFIGVASVTGRAPASNVVWIGSSTESKSIWDIGARPLFVGSTNGSGNLLTVAEGGVLTNATAVTLRGDGATFTLGGMANVGRIDLDGADTRLIFDGGVWAIYPYVIAREIVGSGRVILNEGTVTTIDCDYSARITTAIEGPGALAVYNSTSFELRATNTYSGGTIISNSQVATLSPTAVGSGPVTMVGTNSRLTVRSSLIVNNLYSPWPDSSIILQTTNAMLAVHADDENYFAGTITNAGRLVKAGPGTLVLSGTNVYTGMTIVSNGTLRITGRLDNTVVAVTREGTLAGDGVIGGPVSIDGTLAPGAGVGTLTISNALSCSPDAVLHFDLGTSNDRIAVTGALTLDGTLNIVDAGGFTTNTYVLFTYPSGQLTDNGLVIGTVPNAAYTYTIDTSVAGEVRLVVSEDWPSTFDAWIANYPGVDGWDEDSDGDGEKNLMEYALGRDPSVPDSRPPLVPATVVNDAMTLTYQRRRPPTDVTCAVDGSSLLNGAWTTNGIEEIDVSDDGNALTETVTVRDGIAITNAMPRFYRLKVSQP